MLKASIQRTEQINMTGGEMADRGKWVAPVKNVYAGKQDVKWSIYAPLKIASIKLRPQ